VGDNGFGDFRYSNPVKSSVLFFVVYGNHRHVSIDTALTAPALLMQYATVAAILERPSL